MQRPSIQPQDHLDGSQAEQVQQCLEYRTVMYWYGGHVPQMDVQDQRLPSIMSQMQVIQHLKGSQEAVEIYHVFCIPGLDVECLKGYGQTVAGADRESPTLAKQFSGGGMDHRDLVWREDETGNLCGQSTAVEAVTSLVAQMGVRMQCRQPDVEIIDDAGQ